MNIVKSVRSEPYQVGVSHTMANVTRAHFLVTPTVEYKSDAQVINNIHCVPFGLYQNSSLRNDKGGGTCVVTRCVGKAPTRGPMRIYHVA
jgi:hypothetical protein